MTFLSYAQNFEDVILWRALRDVPRGHYLDVGAQDPNADSVSRAFYDVGWRGIHVEPTARYAARLREFRPDETVIEAAVSDLPGPIEFWEIPETGLSTGKEDIAAEHGRAGFQSRKLFVPCVSLRSLFALLPAGLQWMKVDVEGMEADVLRSWGQSPTRPWIVVVESTLPNSQHQTHLEWVEELLRRDYQEVLFDGLSRYFLHQDQLARAALFEAPANIFDDFVVQSGHFTARLMREELQAVRSELAGEHSQIVDLQHRLEQAEASVRQAQSEHSSVLQALATAEREHRISSHQLWRERHESETALRREHAEVVSHLTEAVHDARSREAAAYARSVALDEKASRLSSELDAVVARAAHTQASLEGQIQEQQTELMRVADVIRNAAASIGVRRQHLLVGLGLSARPHAWNELKRWSSRHRATVSQPTNHETGQKTEKTLTTMITPKRNAYLRAASLEELISFNDVDFVRCAYVTILGRQPDRPGEAYYTLRLREGHSKLQVLWQLRQSPEAKAHDPGIAGLDRALKIASWHRMPLLGAVARILTRGGERDDRLSRIHRSLSNDLATIKSLLGWKDEIGSTEASMPARPSLSDGLLSGDESKQSLSEAEFSPSTFRALDILIGDKAR